MHGDEAQPSDLQVWNESVSAPTWSASQRFQQLWERQSGARRPMPATGCQLPSDCAISRQSDSWRRPSRPPVQSASVRGSTSRFFHTSQAAVSMSGGGGGATAGSK